MSVNAQHFAKPKRDRGLRHITSEEEKEIHFAFTTLDTERVGFVTPKQLKVALRALGFPVKKTDVLELMRAYCDDATTQLDFSLFHKIVSSKLAERSPYEEFHRAFQLFDVHGTGRIDASTLKRVTKQLGLNIPETELQDMIDEFDADGDGMISEREFLSIMVAADE